MKQSFDVVVLGGGVVGLTAAIAMSQRDLSVALIDAGGLTTDIGRMDSRVYAINQASQSLLDELGVWKHLDTTRLSPYQHMRVWDSASHARIDFDSRMVGRDCLGMIIEEAVLKNALLQQMSHQNVVLFPHSKMTTVRSRRDDIVVCDSEHSWQAKLLIVADGAASTARELLGVSLTSWSYHQHAIVTRVHTEKNHQQTAYQVFNADGPLALLPLTDPHQCSIVWSTTPTRAQALMSLQDEAFAAELARAFEAQLGACEVLEPRHSFPLHMRHAQSYSGAHWLLMGDAAHTIHPLAGLGLNIGLADLAAWLALLGADNQHLHSHQVLRAYQRQRKHAVWKMIVVMEGLKTIFSHPLPPMMAIRAFGLRMCDQWLPLKRYFIEQAAG
jgi:2-octaprenylphenol hydroxylase